MSGSRKARDLVKGALRQINAIGVGETPSAEDLSDGLDSLSAMLESWAIEKLMVFAPTREVFTLVPGQEMYTIGPTGNFNTSSPVDILLAGIQLVGSTPPAEIPLEIVTLQQRADTRMKDLQSTIPRDLYYENGAPFSRLYLYPVPAYAHQIVIYSNKQLLSITDGNTDLILPSGYWDALLYNLAVKRAPEYGKEPSQTVMSMAVKSKAAVKRANYRPSYMKGDPAVMGRTAWFNILTGYGGR